MTNGEETMAVGEVARRAGVSTATVNFYVREGLLPRPRKTARTRAEYPASTVARIGRIRSLQSKGMPLRLIRLVLDSTDLGATLGLEQDQRGEARRQTPARVTGVEAYLRETGLRESTFAELVELGLLQTRGGTGAGEPAFDRQDIAAGRALAALLTAGVTLGLLARHSEYEPIARAEAHFLAEHLTAARSAARSGERPAALVVAAFGVVRDYLRLRQLDAAYGGWAAGPPGDTPARRAGTPPVPDPGRNHGAGPPGSG